MYITKMERQRDLNHREIFVFLVFCLTVSVVAKEDVLSNAIEDVSDAQQEAIKADCENWETNGKNSGRAGTNYWHFLNCRQVLKYSDDDVDMTTYQTPDNYDLDTILEAVTEGDGYFIMRNAVSEEDVEMARERVIYHSSPKKYRGKLFDNPVADEKHNNYGGMIWGLLNKGRIFEKFVLHPAVRNISRNLLGDQSQVSSLSANTVFPGSKAQPPHLDYPYYRNLYPKEDKYRAPMMAPLMVLQFVVLLTEFNKNNGGTAIRPNSHKVPTYPADTDEFFKNAIQVEGKPGDIAVFAGSIQHCAMPNQSKNFRSGVLLHMGAVHVRPFENIRGLLDEKVRSRATPELREALALDFPYPKMNVQ